jgi:hypothetical protein
MRRRLAILSTRPFRHPDHSRPHGLGVFASHRLVNPENIPEARTVVVSSRLPSVNEVPTERKSDPASDHAAVVATFTS